MKKKTLKGEREKKKEKEKIEIIARFDLLASPQPPATILPRAW